MADRATGEPVKRPLWTVLVLLLLSAVALWGSSRLTWATEWRVHPGTDAATVVSTTGGGVAPLVPLAVLALAGVAAAVALGGWARRILGAVLGVAGLVTAGIGPLVTTMTETDFVPWGRILAVAGGVLLVLAGFVLVWLGDRMPRLGAAYQTPGAAGRDDDSDSAMWHALSQGKDPTTNDR
jgi:hypothetical protein